jgi:hypothetical protein
MCRSLAETNTFVQVQGVSMTVLGIFAGAAMGLLRRYKVGVVHFGSAYHSS